MQQPEPRNPAAELKGTFDALTALCAAVAFPVVLCTTRFGTWGTRYLGPPAVLGFFWPLIFAAFYGPHPHLIWVVWFWGLSFVLLLVHRVQGVRLRARGHRCHSRYWGQSRFARRDDPDERATRFRASLVALAAGGACFVSFIKPLGALFVLGAVAKLLSDALGFHAIAVRLQQMDDARLENEYYLELYRRRYGPR